MVKVKGNTWHVATKWGGSWSVTRSVPSAFLKIPSSHTAHACVKAHPNYKPPSRPSRVTRPHPVHPVHPVRPGSPAPKPPTAAVAREPGVRAIPRTGIQHAVVRGAHVFRYGGRWYKVSGRTWYVSTRWGAAWTVTASVPDVFLKIPSTHSAHSCVKVHPKYRVRKREKDEDDDKGRPKRWGPRNK